MFYPPPTHDRLLLEADHGGPKYLNGEIFMKKLLYFSLLFIAIPLVANLDNLKNAVIQAHAAVKKQDENAARMYVNKAIAEANKLKSIDPNIKRNLGEALVDIDKGNWGPAGRFIMFTHQKLSQIK